MFDVYSFNQVWSEQAAGRLLPRSDVGGFSTSEIIFYSEYNHSLSIRSVIRSMNT